MFIFVDVGSILSQLFNVLIKTSISGFFPFLYLLVLVTGIIAIGLSAKRTNSTSSSQSATSTFKGNNYFDTFSNVSTIFENVLFISAIYMIVSISLLITRKLLGISKIASNESTTFLFEFLTSLMFLVVTLTMALVIFDKKSYLVFNVKNVMKQYHFSLFFGGLLFSWIIAGISTFITLNTTTDSIFFQIAYLSMEASTLICICVAGYEISVALRILFLNPKYEGRLLNNIYRAFWSLDEFSIRNVDDWDEHSARKQIEFLANTYNVNCESIREKGFKDVEFHVIDDAHSFEYMRRIRVQNIGVVVFLFGLSSFLCWLLSPEGFWSAVILNLIPSIISIGLSFKNKSRIQRVFIRLLSHDSGYKISEGEKRRYIPLITFPWISRYQKYVTSLNSLLAFIFIEKHINMNKRMITDSILILAEILSQDKKMDTLSSMPIIAAGYFAFVNGEKMTIVKNNYCNLTKKNGNRNMVDTSIGSQIYYMTKNLTASKGYHQKMTGEYFAWLHEDI